jgi:putative NIF3 family GTP cyclohydrolase 1 type 2
MLGLKNIKPFMKLKGQTIGFRGTRKIHRDKTQIPPRRKLGSPCMLLPFGPETSQSSASSQAALARKTPDAHFEGVDTYVTGEGPHWTWGTAQELKINVIYGGHYKTESFGIQALAENLSGKFSLPWHFLDDPSGL